ncbi:DEAD/DEAH box helicase [Caminibacter sp.]
MKTLFYSKNNFINEQLNSLITADRFTKGPYVEQIFDFEKGKSVKEFIEKRILHKDVEKILKSYEISNLYFHQEEVIEKAIIQNKNIIISTGTGSGKTLSFLLPVIDYILKNPSNGVKALFLYPMNALANDQLKDLRVRLKNLPQISFGRYTGETLEKKKDAIEAFKAQNIEILENERKSREEILKNPPDILITNYSMLEFLLLRPKDTILFEGDSWKFIVLDEIHTYDGAKGSEIGYLLRRLKDRVFKDKRQKPLCIGASATLGDKENNKNVAEFAEGIFGEKFDGDSVIRAKYQKSKIIENGLWKLNFSIQDLLKQIEKTKSLDELIDLLKEKRDFDITKKEKKEIIKDFLKNNYELNKLKSLLLKEPLTIQELSNELGLEENELSALIELAFESELLNAKYHFFVKAADGLYGIIDEKGNIEEIFFDKKIKYKNKKVFELSSCSNCGEIFITGYLTKKGFLEIGEGDENDILRINKNKRIYLSKKNGFVEDEDEKNVNVKSEQVYLNIFTGQFSNSKKEGFIEFLKLDTINNIDSIKCCPNCGKCNKNNSYPLNYRFVTGDEIPQSVLLSSLYKQLPNDRKKSLVFSDSRRDAAFFAPFFEKIYNDAMNRRKILYILNNENRKISYSEMINDYLQRDFRLDRKIKYKDLLIKEFSLKDNKALENIGLIKFVLDEELENEILSRVRFLYNHLNEKDILSLIYGLLLTLRESFAIEADTNIADALEMPFKETPCFKKESDKPCFGWIGNNKRVDFISKVLKTNLKDSKKILENIWDGLTSTNLFSNEEGKRRLKIDNWNLELNENIFRCKKCGKIHNFNVKNVCRVFKCDGKLEKISKEDILESKYYIDLYEENLKKENLLSQSKMIIKEHTAQLDREEAQKVQKDFERGKINILSCSTTFELGVDIGTLENVFLHNIPPKPDNYIQRAGRAGRSSDSVAFILTFANRRAHDMKYFENPIPLITGQMKTPVITIENIRIIRRHINALSLSYFLKKEFQGHNKITLKNFLDKNGFENFKDFINSKPIELKNSIKNIIPKKLHNILEIENWGWIRDNKDEKYEGCLDLWEKIEVEVKSDIDEYENLKQKAKDEDNFYEAQKMKEILNYYENIDIISLFSRKIFIPKYGFPVDTVSLDTSRIGLKNLSLDRDLSIAIREYAPEEEVIADKKLIISGNMKIVKGKMPDVIQYYFCSKCAKYEEKIDLEIPSRCPNCGEKLRKDNKGKYIVPIFGFEAKEFKNKIPMRKPIPLSKIRSFYIGEDGTIEEKSQKNLKLTFTKRGKIAVINLDRNIDINSGQFVLKSNYKLGYNFYTDVLIVENIEIGKNLIKNYSLLYALLEGASKALDIKREDINGTLAPMNENNFKIILFDNVPAGAGFMKVIFNSFNEVINSAFEIVNNCKCDEDTCCPVCLEHISNQYIINFIKRKEAKNILSKMIKNSF